MAGETFCPLQVYFSGMGLPLSKCSLVRTSGSGVEVACGAHAARKVTRMNRKKNFFMGGLAGFDEWSRHFTCAAHLPRTPVRGVQVRHRHYNFLQKCTSRSHSK